MAYASWSCYDCVCVCVSIEDAPDVDLSAYEDDNQEDQEDADQPESAQQQSDNRGSSRSGSPPLSELSWQDLISKFKRIPGRPLQEDEQAEGDGEEDGAVVSAAGTPTKSSRPAEVRAPSAARMTPGASRLRPASPQPQRTRKCVFPLAYAAHFA